MLLLTALGFFGPIAPSSVLSVAPPVHCQVPCGIYNDELRIAMLREHAATIEKAMTQIVELGAADRPNWNQLVRWINAKEEHAQAVQDQISAYWLAQRIKAPESGPSERFQLQLVGAHGVITAAMRCKQGTDAQVAAALVEAIERFEKVYSLTAEDLERAREFTEGVTSLHAKHRKAQRKVAKATLKTLHNAILTYRLDHLGAMPNSLEELVKETASGARYIDRNEVPKDPWGNGFVYAPEDGDTPMTLMSYGADGKAGGEGDDADITIQAVMEGR